MVYQKLERNNFLLDTFIIIYNSDDGYILILYIYHVSEKTGYTITQLPTLPSRH